MWKGRKIDDARWNIYNQFDSGFGSGALSGFHEDRTDNHPPLSTFFSPFFISSSLLPFFLLLQFFILYLPFLLKRSPFWWSSFLRSYVTTVLEFSSVPIAQKIKSEDKKLIKKRLSYLHLLKAGNMRFICHDFACFEALRIFSLGI